ncbi:MAG: hypothetical protein ACRD8W_06400 [Nitrososphaeraceae archaeon]
MASHYFCFKCRDNGFPSEPVVFAGKDSAGKTILNNPDSTPHQHKEKQQQEQEQEQQPSTDFQVSQESVDRGITAFTMMTALIGLVEQNQKELVKLNEKVEYLTKLVYALSSQQLQK